MTKALPWLLLIGVSWFGGCQYAKNRELDARAAALAYRNGVLLQAINAPSNAM